MKALLFLSMLAALPSVAQDTLNAYRLVIPQGQPDFSIDTVNRPFVFPDSVPLYRHSCLSANYLHSLSQSPDIDWDKYSGSLQPEKKKQADTLLESTQESLPPIPPLPSKPERKPLKFRKVSESSAALWYLSGGGILAAGLVLLSFRIKTKQAPKR